MDNAFATALRRRRRSGLLSQEELAARSGLSVRTIRYLESGRVGRPRRESVLLLADALGLRGTDRTDFAAVAGLGAEEPARGAVRQLPRDLPDFAERDAAVAAAVGALAGGPAAPVEVVTVTGPAGVGKTALAVHVAHRVRDRFPDGQLHVRLRRGDTAPLPPAEVLGRFLRALGVDGSVLPPDVDELAALFRSRLDGRRMLVLLDDAVAEEQVRPLLPGGAGSAVLVTGRGPLAGLEGAHPVPLEVLDRAAAVRLLARITGPARVAAEAAAADRIAAVCGGLPLAVRVVGSRLAGSPAADLAALADRLTDEHGRLDELAAGDLGVRASFRVGYDSLDAPARRLFRLSGLLPTADLPAWAAAALLDTDPATAAAAADRLADAGLIDRSPDRYGRHDLVRLYAREQSLAEDPPADRAAAVRRVLSGWAALADAADRRLPSDALALPDRVRPGWRPDPATTARLLRDPLDWFEQERPGLVDAVALAAEQAPDLCAGIADSMVDFCATRDYPDDWAAVAGALLRAAEATGDRRLAGAAERRLAELSIYRDGGVVAEPAAARALAHAEAAGDGWVAAAARLIYGSALRVSGRVADAEPYLREAEAGFRALDEAPGAGHAHLELGLHAEYHGDLPRARDHFAAAVELLDGAGDLRGYANGLLHQGSVAHRTGDHAAALPLYEQATAVFERIGDRGLRAAATLFTGHSQVELGDLETATRTLTAALAEARELHRSSTVGAASRWLGEAHLRAGDLSAARDCFTEARAVCAGIDMMSYVAFADVGLGEVALAEGDVAAARARWEQAVEVLATAVPDRAEMLRARLAALP